jgi:DnaJ-domain-containing protein 1
VEGFIDRLAEFLRSLFSDDGRTAGGRSRGGDETRFRDPDMQSAWEELDDYMRDGTHEAGRGSRERESTRPPRPVDESLRADYANLEVPFGADMATVVKSYKSLMLKYHPDKHSGDPEKQKIALDITKRINQSYERIRSRQEGPSS